MNYELPPALRGSESEMLAQLASYIFRLVQYLNTAAPETVKDGGAGGEMLQLRKESADAAARTRKLCTDSAASLTAGLTALSGDVERSKSDIDALETAYAALTAAVCPSGCSAAVAGDLSVAGSVSIGGVTLTGERLAELLSLGEST